MKQIILQEDNTFLGYEEKPLTHSTYSLPSSLIYVVKDDILKSNDIEPEIKEIIKIGEINYTHFPTFLTNPNKVYIPVKIETVIKRHISKKELKRIDGDVEVAIEKCILFISNLSSTYFEEEDRKWKSLYSSILDEQMGRNSNNDKLYPIVKDILLKGTKNGPIILCDEKYIKGDKSKSYRLTDTYLKGLTTYEFKTKEIISIRTKNFYDKLAQVSNNVISRNLINLYSKIELPTQDEILEEGKRLVKIGYTKKGKKLTIRNKKSDNHWKDTSKRTFVEDNIELFNYLTSNGFMIPIIGDEKSGGRVVDSFTLMPSWIRNLIKIGGESIVELDYSTLHPNLAKKIYGGDDKTITHKMVADELGISVSEAKIEHLSFFNKRWSQMEGSKLFAYYFSKERVMLDNIFKDKNNYKNTSMKLFKMEVEIMTEVISRLNNKGVYVLYIYDALACKQSDENLVRKIMKEVSNEFGLNLEVK
jgi:hypothetical protein